MNGDLARDLLLTEEEGRGLGEHVLAPAHLQTCAACRDEFAALEQAHALLKRGVAAMTEEITPSAAFWSGLEAKLDIAERESRRPSPRARLRTMLHQWGRRLLALGTVAVLLGGGATVAAGGPQHAWAALRAWLYAVPFVGAGLGQIEPGTLVANGPITTSNGTITLTVDGLVAARHATLVAYHLSSIAPPAGGNAPVADAVDAVLVGANGRRYLPSYWQPTTSATASTGVVTGLLAFQPLAPGERSLRLEAARLPLAPPVARPWSITLALRPAGAGTALASVALDQSITHHGVRLTVTDVTATGGAIVVDMDSAVVGNGSRGGAVVSLTAEQAMGTYAPLLTTRAGDRLWPLPPALTAPVRASVVPRPEFVYGPAHGTIAGLTLSVAAVAVREAGSTTVVARAGQGARAVLVGRHALQIVSVREVAPPAALGLDGEQRLRITVGFPPGQVAGSLDRIDAVIGGVRYTISRDDPHVDLPLASGQHAVTITLQDPVVTVQGPWTLSLNGRGNG